MDREAGRRFIRANFSPEDRLAVVLIQKHSSSVTQRLASAAQIADEKFQNWLRYMNAQKHEVYVSMNPLRPEARGRTKADVAGIRHVYLDSTMTETALSRQCSRGRTCQRRIT